MKSILLRALIEYILMLPSGLLCAVAINWGVREWVVKLKTEVEHPKYSRFRSLLPMATPSLASVFSGIWFAGISTRTYPANSDTPTTVVLAVIYASAIMLAMTLEIRALEGFIASSKSRETWRYWLGTQRDQALPRLFAARISHQNRIGSAMAASVFTAIAGLNLLSRAWGDPSTLSTTENNKLLLTFVLIIVGSIVAFRVVSTTLTLTSPHLSLITETVLTDAEIERLGEKSERSSFRFGTHRWRSDWHRRSFSAASALDRCLPGFQRILGSKDCDLVISTAKKLANSLRQAGIAATTEAGRHDVLSMHCAAVSLLASDYPVGTAEKVGKLVHKFPNPIGVGQRRYVRILGALSEQTQRHWPTFRIVLVCAVIIYLTTTGKLSEIVKLIKL